MFGNIKKAIEELESNLTLKSDYTEELEQLSQYEGDLPVLRSLGTPVWKIQEAREHINRIREWIKQEITANA